MATVIMKYGDYTFSPVPLFNLTREYRKTDDGRILSSIMRLGLEGTLVPSPGLINTDSAVDTLAAQLEKQGCLFTLTCNGTSLIGVYPRVLNVNFKSSNQWVNSVNYTIDFEYDEDFSTDEITGAGLLDSLVEEWTLEPLEDKGYYDWAVAGATNNKRPYLFRLAHNLNGKGRSNYTSSGGCGSVPKEAWEIVKDYITSRLCNPADVDIDIFGLTAGDYEYYNWHRTQNINRYNGTYGIAETWLVYDSTQGTPTGPATEDFTIDIRSSSESDVISVGIQGNIQGFELKNFPNINVISGTVTTTKYANASGYYAALSSANLFYLRAQQALENSNISHTRDLNALKVSKGVGHNVPNGVITYNYEYNNKPDNCVASSLTESITLNIDYPSDVFASLTVLGRTSGPILQLMGTSTSQVIKMGIDVTVPIIAGCTIASWLLTAAGCPHTEVKAYLSGMEAYLDSTYSQLAKNADNIVWNPKEGRYSRNVSWVVGNCSAINTAVSGLD